MALRIPPLSQHDGYKADHRRQYQDKTTYIYSNFTPRKSRVEGSEHMVFFGLQYFLSEYLVKQWQEGFFSRPVDEVVGAYQRRLDTYLGPGAVPVDHVRALHALGYLPLTVCALPEGELVPMQVPCLTIANTHKDFSWLTNYLETILSATIWGPSTSATTAYRYRLDFERFAKQTGADRNFIPWQGHDFSFRGMFGLEAACLSGAGHLLSFFGTDTIPAIDFLEQYYGANANWQCVGGSVPATEHSVMAAGGRFTEIETYRRLLTEVYPKGIVSVVSDTYDFWSVVENMLPALKAEIMAREGKLVIRPDSGDPVKIICGDAEAAEGSAEYKGLIQCLWETFGGTVNETGYKVLDGHIGAIYGDSITPERQRKILYGLKLKGFASSNIVLGIGSYTYQFVTRDVYGSAMKATYCTVDGVGREIFKQPKTDSGKNSHRGLIRVERDSAGELVARFPVTAEEAAGGELKEVFRDGRLLNPTTLAEIRERINAHVAKALA